MLGEGYFAIKLSVAEYYRRELTAGRLPFINPDKGKLMELYAGQYAGQLITDEIKNYYTQIDAKASKSGLVAVINVVGVMSRFGEACAYGTEEIIQQIAAANADERIVAIVLRFVTPGGGVGGTNAFSDSIYYSPKVIVGFASQADSAGYWGISQCAEVYLEDSQDAEVGSIGVYSIHVDERARLEQQGTKITIIRAVGSEDKALFNSYEEVPAEVLAEEQQAVTDIRSEFIGKVKRKRPQIAEEAFSGKTYRGKQAIKLGLVDKIGTLQDAIARADFLSRKAVRANQNSNSNNNTNASEEMGFFGDLWAKHKPADSAAAEELADKVVAQKDAQIAELEKKANEAVAEVGSLKTTVAELKPKAEQYDKIKDEHAANTEYVKNLKDAGITPPKAGGDANANGGKPKRSYEVAEWNQKAVELREKLNS